jgi:cytidyltransferase-like protein
MDSVMTGMLFGTFDRVHMGHAALVEQALQKLDGRGEKGVFSDQDQKKTRLYVVVGRDKTVTGVKGKGPRQNERERMVAIKALFPECAVVLGHKTNRMYWLRKVRPDIVFLGYDQEAFVDILKQELRRQQKVLEKIVWLSPSGATRGLFRKKLSAAGVSNAETSRKNTRIIRLKPFQQSKYKSSKIKTPHILLRGEVVHCKKLARSVGYPTANIRLNGNLKKVVTSSGTSGIYASRALLAVPGRRVRSYLAATVVGARTHERAPLVETHLIGYRGDCYGATLTISLEKKLRNFKTYTTAEALKKDIEKDVTAVVSYFDS